RMSAHGDDVTEMGVYFVTTSPNATLTSSGKTGKESCARRQKARKRSNTLVLD
ncbi:hypothetical protein LTS18_006393, partial [Coniosporium uncinatum]